MPTEFLLHTWVNPGGMPPHILGQIQAALAPSPDGGYPPFVFHWAEIKHAKDLLGPPSQANQDTYAALQLMEAWEFILGAGPDLNFIAKSSDTKRRASEAFGEGVAGLFMSKILNVSWTTMERVPQVSGGGPDFRGKSAGDNFVWEAKGTTSPRTHERQMNRGRRQKAEYVASDVTKLVIGSCFREETGDTESFLEVVDPPLPFDPDLAFSQEADRRYELHHAERALRFAFGKKTPPKSAFNYRYGRAKTQPSRIDLEDYAGITLDLGFQARRLHRAVDVRVQAIQVFHGIHRELLSTMRPNETPMESPYVDWKGTNRLEIGRGYATSVFDDGTVLQVTGLPEP